MVHGGGGGAYDADARLAQNLRTQLGPAYDVQYPLMPDEDEPDYQTWKSLILSRVAEMGDAILVGHSIGASVLIKTVADRSSGESIAGVFLIATPFWHDHEIWRWDEVALRDADAARVPRDLPLFFYHGEADETVPVSHLDLYSRALPHAVVHRLRGRDHQINEDMTEVARDIVALG